jgi:hypothetical protein
MLIAGLGPPRHRPARRAGGETPKTGYVKATKPDDTTVEFDADPQLEKEGRPGPAGGHRRGPVWAGDSSLIRRRCHLMQLSAHGPRYCQHKIDQSPHQPRP